MKHKMLLAMIGVVVGLMLVVQVRSYDAVTALLARDPDVSIAGLSTPEEIFQQIYTLKLANESLKEDISALETQLAQYTDQTSAYDALTSEIEKNEALLGRKPIVGPGLIVEVETPLTVEWLVDLTNELWVVGAEAVSVNGIRLTDDTDGFYRINDWVLLHGTVLSSPYSFAAIGDASVMQALLAQPGGAFGRVEAQFKVTPLFIAQDVIRMEATTPTEKTSE